MPAGNGKSRKRAPVVLHERTSPVADGPTCIDLFAGAGGLAEGFRQAGWSILAAADSDAGAMETFRVNFPEANFYEGPIERIAPQQLLDDAELETEELDCLIGGPPCQSFSYNNHHRSASDERARLFTHYLSVVKKLRPKVLVMENVPGMLTIGGGSVLKEIESRLARLGYETEARILFAEDYGVPQMRRRVFIIATRLGDAQSLFPSGTHGPCEKPSVASNQRVHHWEAGPETLSELVTVWDAIGDLPPIPSGGGRAVMAYGTRKVARTAFQLRCREGSDRLHNHQCHEITGAMLKRVAAIPEGGNWRDIPRKWLPAGMKRARKSDHTKRYGRLRRRDLASTILTKCDPHWGAYIHPTQDRTISVREAARLQGFPDTFRFAGTFISKHYTQVGNAVPPPLAKAIATRVIERVEDQQVAKWSAA